MIVWLHTEAETQSPFHRIQGKFESKNNPVGKESSSQAASL